MSTVVYLIRHSEVAPKSNFKSINNHDSKQIANEKCILSVSGEKKAEQLSKLEELKGVSSVYSSSYVRALETARYIALENNLVINVDDRLDERKIGQLGDMPMADFERLQARDFDFKLNGGESINQVKKRMSDCLKNILMFDSEEKIVIVSHATAIMSLLSNWCEVGHNYDENVILTYNEETIVDGNFQAPHVFKVTFDGLNVLNIEYVDINK
jgi:2,3-bisphosphoglycerate-dependent phosphoglycerate mutase